MGCANHEPITLIIPFLGVIVDQSEGTPFRNPPPPSDLPTVVANRPAWFKIGSDSRPGVSPGWRSQLGASGCLQRATRVWKCPHLLGELLAGPRGSRLPPVPPPAIEVGQVPQKPGRPAAESREPRCGVPVGPTVLAAMGGGWGTANRVRNRSEPSPQKWGRGLSFWALDSPEPATWGVKVEWGRLQGCPGRLGSNRGVSPHSACRGLRGSREGDPPPPAAGPGGAVTQDLAQAAQLRARPPSPQGLNLAPASGDPVPPPRTGTTRACKVQGSMGGPGDTRQG